MPNSIPHTPDRPVLVEDFYLELAADRTAKARRALAAAPFERAFSQSAAVFEDGAAALEHAATAAQRALICSATGIWRQRHGTCIRSGSGCAQRFRAYLESAAVDAAVAG